jgi:hypothetical protein
MMKVSYQRPSKIELKKFGLLFGGFLEFLFGMTIPLIKNWSGPGPLFPSLDYWPVWPWVLATAVASWALIHPGSLFLLHRPWMKFADIAGWINTRIIMLILFYFLIMPMGLLMRLFGYDPMCRKFDKNLASYRVISKPQDRNHMKAPY